MDQIFSTENYINILKIPKKLNIGVMLNVSDLSNYKSDYKKVLNKVFNKNKKTKVKFIRLATHIRN